MTQIDQSLRELTGYLLQRSTIAALSRMNETFATYGLRRSTFSTLALVVENPGLRQGQLAETLGIERPNFVHIVDELEDAGFVSRQVAENDKRAYAMHATLQGRALFHKVQAKVSRVDRELTKGLSAAQLKTLHYALGQIEANSSRMGAQDES